MTHNTEPRLTISTPDWHTAMYDAANSSFTIDSPAFVEKAKHEVAFLFQQLQLKQGDKILDVPCGAGRHAAEFLARGLTVVGVDINELLLDRARKRCFPEGASFVRGTMADLSAFRGQFDVVANLFTSFGYFPTDEENLHVMREMVAALKAGGRLAIHLINRDWLLRVYRHNDWRERDGSFMLEARRYDPVTKYNEVQEIVINRESGQGRNHYHRIRLYSRAEMVDLMKSCGLSKIRVFGNFQGDSFSRYESTHPIFIGERGNAAANR